MTFAILKLRFLGNCTFGYSVYFKRASQCRLRFRFYLWTIHALCGVTAGLSQYASVLLTQTIILFQDVSLVYVISAPDFLGRADTLANTYGPETKATFYLIVAVVYFCSSFVLSQLVKRLQKKLPSFANWRF